MLDVFSRKGIIFGLNNKEVNSVLPYIIDFCEIHNIPREFASDNGAEFKNKFFNDFCAVNNIKFIHGMPFSPHAQDTIERFNNSIKKCLTKEYLANEEKTIDFKTVKIKVINFYNNKFHRHIGMTPNEAYKITDKEEINKIKEIKIKEYEKINKKRNYLSNNDTCLLNPKFLKIGKNTLVANRVKKGKFANKIPVRVLKRSSYG